MSNSITAPITIIQNTINAPVTLGIIGGGGGDLTSGPVRATNGVSSIANGALSIAMTSGLQTALDAKQATLTNYSTISALTGYPTSFPTTPADINNVGTSKLLGRHGAGTGTAQEIGIDGGLELHGGNLRRAALTGVIEASAGSGTTTLSASAASEGGNGAADAGKLAKYDSSGRLIATDGDGIAIRLGGTTIGGILQGGEEGATWVIVKGDNTTDVIFQNPSESGTFALVSQIPDISGKQDTITIETSLSFYSLELGTALPITSGGTGGITAGAARSSLDAQQTLVSGTNIRPVAGQSLLGSTNIPALLTDPTGITGAAALSNIVSLTQAQYDAIGSKSSTTLYVIT